MANFITQYRTPEEWLAARQGKIGGSDIGAIVGLNPWRSPFDVYAEKQGLVEVVENRAMRLGKLLEPVILTEYGAQSGNHVQPMSLAVIVHPAKPWAIASIDALAVRPTGGELGVEAKSASTRQSHRWGEEGSDKMPEEYLCQVHWYRAILEIATDGAIADWDLAVLIGGADFRVYHVFANRELEGVLFEEAEKFWRDHIVGQRPPAFSGSTAERDWIKTMFPRDTAPLRQATEVEDVLIEGLLALKENIDALNREREGMENLLKSMIAEAAGIISQHGNVYWKRTKDVITVDWEGVARELGATDELIAKYTATREGSRRLLLPRGGK